MVDGVPLRRRDDLSRSAAGFDWGYAGGGGPTQLSWAILTHFFDDDRKARRYCSHFLRAVVAHLEPQEWALTSAQIGERVGAGSRGD
jgi:hypothetical protein